VPSEASRLAGPAADPGAGLDRDRDPEVAVLRSRTQAALEGDRDEIPLLNRVALKLRALMRDPRAHAAEVARVIRSDQALATRVMRLANSAHYGTFGPVANLGQAIRRVGFRAVEGIVVAASTQALYRPRTAAEAGLMSGLWDHALAVATAARRIARDVRRGDPEQAFLAGLLHDIGRAMALRVLGEGNGRAPGERRVLPPERILRLIDAVHTEVGGQLLEKWGFPQEVVLATRAHHSPAEVPDGETIPLAVALGDLVATRAGLDVTDLPPGAPPVEGLARRLGLEASQLATVEKDLIDLHAEMKRLLAA
jgi:putative nucleotidyltransferase with HDIG domain